jgi:amino acid adenylation domain-containing protein
VVVDRHAVLRSRILWEGVERPLQVVERRVEVPVEHRVWAEEGAGDAQRLEEFLAEDRRRGFALSEAPLLRLTVLTAPGGARRLVWTLHHVLLDGWSVLILLRELVSCARVLARGEHPSLPPLRPYRDYIAWLGEQDMRAAETWWRRALQGLQAPTRLLGDRSPAAPGAMQMVQVEALLLREETTARLQELCRRRRLTLSTILQGAWGLLLSRYTGSRDVVFGNTVAGRPAVLGGVDGMVGLFINTVPVRVRLEPERALASWLGQLQAEQVELREYEQTPLVAAQGWSGLESGTALFDTLMVFENYPAGDWEGSGAEELELVRVVEQTNYPLTLAVAPGRRLAISALYDTLRFEPRTMARLLGHLERLLEAMAEAPEARLEELDLLGEAERRQLLLEWNDTVAEFPADRCIHELIEDQAERRPHRVAIICGDRRLSYGELNRRANRLAHHLRGLGVGPEVVVGVSAERSTEMVVGLLGVLKAGGAYMPLDPHHPDKRLRFMLEESQARVLLSPSALVSRLPAHPRLVLLDEELHGCPETNPDPGAQAGNLAYVIYTSGSSGQPKGVEVQHRGLTNLVTWHNRHYTVAENDRGAWLAAIGFDASVWELWPYLAAGASVAIGGDEVRQEPRELPGWLSEQGVTICFLATPLVEVLLSEPGLRLDTVRALLTGGDRLTRAPGKGLGVRLFNHYGPTECTVVATAGEVEAGEAGAEWPAIGSPIANTQLYVLDRFGRPAPVGVAGELYIGGAGVARGYLRRPELTAERFVENPFGPGRLYRTGDLVRWRDGSLEYLGRQDAQVKIRGHRVELGEIESALRRQPGVRQAAVSLHDAGFGEKRLVAYVVPAAGHAADTAALGASLSERLPEYMLPSAFVQLDRLPLTSNGKIDRTALPAPELGRLAIPHGHVAPRTREEAAIAAIWRRVLRVEAVGAHDDFFKLGGHSLLVVRMLAEVERELGRHATIAAFIRGGSTVAGLASLLGQESAPPLTGTCAAPRAPSARRPALFTVFSDESSMVALRHFVLALEPAQSVVGLLPPRRNRRFEPDTTVVRLAEALVEEIREREPRGPYRLCGHSLGGLLAYEIAGQLRSRGEVVAWLGLLDTPTPAVGRQAFTHQRRLGWRMRRFRARAQLIGLSGAAWEVVIRRVLRVRALLRLPLPPDDWDGPGALRIAMTYSVEPHDAPLDIFVTGRGLPQIDSPGLGWDELHRGPLLYHPVPGDHGSLLEEPNVHQMLDIVALRLHEAAAGSREHGGSAEGLEDG